MSLADWLPFPLTLESLVMFVMILGISLAGGFAGIVARHYQSGNWHFGPEDRLYLGLVAAVAVLYMVTATPAEQVFTYSAGINGGLGILRNLYEKREGSKTEPELPITKADKGKFKGS